MKQMEISKLGAVLIVGVTIVGGIIVGLCYAFGPAAQQQRNMALCAAHCEKLAEVTAGDPRYEFVEFTYTTSENMSALGHVGSQEDLDDLMEIVRTSDPPRPVRWHVAVVDLELLREPNAEVASNKQMDSTSGEPPESH
jgi:hypothetical protein